MHERVGHLHESVASQWIGRQLQPPPRTHVGQYGGTYFTRSITRYWWVLGQTVYSLVTHHT